MHDHPAIQTVLAATDLSAHSEPAVSQAAAIARSQNATLALLFADVDGTEHTAQAQLAERVRQIEGVVATSQVAVGHAEDVIVESARAMHADLIVTGTHGRTGLKRFFLGSVAEKVVRLAQTNVLVTRARGSGPDGLYSRILVPTDFSDGAERALHLAMLLAAPGATIELFHAWQYPSGTHSHHALPDDEHSPLAALRREIVEAAKTHGDQWVARHANETLTLRFVQDYGPAAGAVQEKLEKEAFELVAMGTHGRRGFRRFVLGSVAEATVRHSPCSVLVAHAGDV